MPYNTGMNDQYDFQRFVAAQDPVYERVCAELRKGSKSSHWMWFVFPQIKGLGRSSMSAFYALGSRDEAAAYLEHTVLGPRLRECCEIVVAVEERSAEQIFGYLDSQKFRSSLTLFAQSTTDNAVFLEALRKYFNGKLDPQTLSRL